MSVPRKTPWLPGSYSPVQVAATEDLQSKASQTNPELLDSVPKINATTTSTFNRGEMGTGAPYGTPRTDWTRLTRERFRSADRPTALRQQTHPGITFQRQLPNRDTSPTNTLGTPLAATAERDLDWIGETGFREVRRRESRSRRQLQ